MVFVVFLLKLENICDKLERYVFVNSRPSVSPFTGRGKSNEKTRESSFILSIDKLSKLVLFLMLLIIFENVVAGVVEDAGAGAIK